MSNEADNKNFNLINAGIFESEISKMIYSKCGKYLLILLVDNRIYLNYIETNSILPLFSDIGNGFSISNIAFSADSSMLACSTHDGKILILCIKDSITIVLDDYQEESVNCVDFSPDSGYIISGGYDKTIKIWHLRTRLCIENLEGHTEEILSLIYSSNGKYIASYSFDKTLKIWENHQCIFTLRHITRVIRLVFHPSCKKLAIATMGNEIIILDFSKENKITYLRTNCSHCKLISFLSFNQNGTELISGSYDKTIKIYDSDSGHCKLIVDISNFGVPRLFFYSNQKYYFTTFNHNYFNLYKGVFCIG